MFWGRFSYEAEDPRISKELKMTRFTRIWLTKLVLFCLLVSTINAQAVLPYHRFRPQLDLHDSKQPDDDPTPSPTPTPDPEVEKANKEKTLSEAKKAAEDAKKAASDAEAAATAARLAAARAKLGLSASEAAPSATAPSGNTTAGEAAQFMETQILADTGGRMASIALVKHLCGIEGPAVKALTATPIKTLIVNNANDKAGVSQYRTTVAQLQLLHDHYLKLMKQSAAERDDTKATSPLAPLLIPAATEVVKNVADLINLFRTETQISSQTVTVDSRFIVSNLANQLLAIDNAQCKVKAIYHPAVYPLTVPPGAKSALFDAYKQLLDDVIDGDRELAANAKKVAALNKDKADNEAAITKLQGQIADAKKKLEEQKKPAKGPKKSKKKTEPEEPPFDIAKAEAEIDTRRTWIDTKLAPRIERLQQAAEALTTFKTSLTKLFEILTAVDDTTKQPLFNSLVSAERLSDLLANSATYVLTLNVKATGTNRSRKNLFFNAKLDHSGGASIDANLFNSQDQLVFGKVENFYIEFTDSKTIRERSGFKRLDQVER